MGRLKTLMSHTRQMEMTLTDKTVKYSIPLHSERGHIGMFRGMEVGKDEIKLFFDTTTKEVEDIKEPSLKIDNTPNTVEFN